MFCTNLPKSHTNRKNIANDFVFDKMCGQKQFKRLPIGWLTIMQPISPDIYQMSLLCMFIDNTTSYSDSFFIIIMS